MPKRFRVKSLWGEDVGSLKVTTEGGTEGFLESLGGLRDRLLAATGGTKVWFEYVNKHGETVIEHAFLFLKDEKKKDFRSEDFMKVKLEGDADDLTLIIRKDSLYLVGFATKHGFYELRSGIRLFRDAELLKFDVNYQSMLKLSSQELKEDMSIKFDHGRLAAAIAGLNSRNVRDADRKSHLAAIIIMVIESIRFPNIMKAMENRTRHEMDCLSNEMMKYQIQNWETKSIVMWNYRNAVDIEKSKKLPGESIGMFLKTLLVEDFENVDVAATQIMAVHRSKEEKLSVKTPVDKDKGRYKKYGR